MIVPAPSRHWNVLCKDDMRPLQSVPGEMEPFRYPIAGYE